MKRLALIFALLGPQAFAVDIEQANCQAPTETFLIPDGGNCPTSALVGRRSIQICSDPRNVSADGGVAYAKVRVDQRDGGAADMGDSPGRVLKPGECQTYALVAGQPARCAVDSTDAGVRTLECK